jgi:hypothetical protein
LAGSLSRGPPPICAQFNPRDSRRSITMLAIACRFKKLEKWTIGHVQTMEDRMNEVEQRLVKKDSESQRRRTEGLHSRPSSPRPQLMMKRWKKRFRASRIRRDGEGDDEEGCIAFQRILWTQIANCVGLDGATVRVHPALPPLTLDLAGTPKHSRVSPTALETTSHQSLPPTTDNLMPRFHTPRRASARCVPTQKFACTLSRRWLHPRSPHSVAEYPRPRLCLRSRYYG